LTYLLGTALALALKTFEPFKPSIATGMAGRRTEISQNGHGRSSNDAPQVEFLYNFQLQHQWHHLHPDMHLLQESATATKTERHIHQPKRFETFFD
jgi:hypothetical protein